MINRSMSFTEMMVEYRNLYAKWLNSDCYTSDVADMLKFEIRKAEVDIVWLLKNVLNKPCCIEHEGRTYQIDYDNDILVYQRTVTSEDLDKRMEFARRHNII